jgi:hypothetical protein
MESIPFAARAYRRERVKASGDCIVFAVISHMNRS